MSNKVPIVIVLVENVVYFISSVKLSGESQISCARLVKVRIYTDYVVALWEVGL